MLRKLYSLVSGATSADNPDSPQHHEVLLPGFLYGMIIKERFEECLNGVKAQITQDMRQKKDKPFTDRKLCFILAPFQRGIISSTSLLARSYNPKASFILFLSPLDCGETIMSSKFLRRRRDIFVPQIPQATEGYSCHLPDLRNIVLPTSADNQPSTLIQS
jgi:hypothetical protein